MRRTQREARLVIGSVLAFVLVLTFASSALAASTVTLNVQPPQVSVGEEVNFTATLTGTGPSPGGQIRVTIFQPSDVTCASGTLLASAPATDGAVAGTFSRASPGTYRLVASFTGNPADLPASTACNAPNTTVDIVEEAPPPQTDGTAPSAELTKTPKKKSKSRTATFQFGSNEPGVTFKCAIDKKSFKPCESPKKFRKLKFRKHRFQLVATDAAGNQSEQTTFRWRVVD